jgi:DTW domain-containing protein YfiP
MPVCICDLVTPIAIRTPLLVLLHRLEAPKTTNTGRMAALALGARLERWGEIDRSRPTLPDGELLVLFPLDDARPLVPADAERRATLVVPDGNWPQARKIARRVLADAGARATPVRLTGERPSGYALRHTRRQDATSTLEAIAHALRVLEGPRGEEVERQTLALFDAFVARHVPFAYGPRDPP